jgi:multiple sugar transport system permease protein
MLSDAQLGGAWINTFLYVALAVAAETVFGILAAALINHVKYGRKWLLAAVVLPWALPAVVNAVIWLWIYQPGAGLLNGILTAFGLPFENHVWFNERTSAIVAVTVVHVWRMMPLTVVIVLAAMQSVPDHLYEAARIDGATRTQMFTTITLPLIRSAVAVSMTNATIYAFNLFDEAWVLAGSSLETRPVLVQIYLETFQNLHFSYGMAMSLVITLVSLLVSLVFVLRVYRNTRFD